MTRTLTLAALALTVAAPAFAGAPDFLRQFAEQDDNRQLVRFIDSGEFDGSYVTLPGDAPRISALEVALMSAEENNDFQAAKNIRAQIAGLEDVTTSVSSKSAPSISALEVALKSAIESDDRAQAAYIRSVLAND